MDTYNTPPNGIDYDPDLLYGGEAMPRPGSGSVQLCAVTPATTTCSRLRNPARVVAATPPIPP